MSKSRAAQPRARDPYNRQWVKVPTDTFIRERFCDLSHTETGVLVRAMIGLSVPKSYDIGYFTDKATDEPWSRAHIVKQIRPAEGNAAKHDAEAHDALQRLVDVGLAREDETNGYYFDPEIFEPWLHENNRIAKRDADAVRQQRKRARDAEKARKEQKAAAAAKPAKKPTPLRAVSMRSVKGEQR